MKAGQASPNPAVCPGDSAMLCWRGIGPADRGRRRCVRATTGRRRRRGVGAWGRQGRRGVRSGRRAVRAATGRRRRGVGPNRRGWRSSEPRNGRRRVGARRWRTVGPTAGGGAAPTGGDGGALVPGSGGGALVPGGGGQLVPPVGGGALVQTGGGGALVPPGGVFPAPGPGRGVMARTVAYRPRPAAVATASFVMVFIQLSLRCCLFLAG